MRDKIFITCALTGAAPLPPHPRHPVTPEQIATAGLEAAEAGASIIHVHVRDPATGEFSGELELYAEVVRRIREQNKKVLINLTTGLGSGFYPSKEDPSVAGPGSHMWSAKRRAEHVIALKPDICTLDLVTAQVFGGVVMSLDSVITEMALLIRSAGVTPEIELFDTGDMVFANHLMAKGALDGPGLYSFVMGLNFTMPATTEMMLHMRNSLPKGAVWTGFGIGRHQFPMATQSALLGGNVRVGMEDNIYISKGVLTPNNAALVHKAVEIVERLGVEIADPDETRKILGI